MFLSLKIAWRFIAASKAQSFFIIFIIAIGVSVQIFIGILIDSLQYTLVNTTIGSAPHITLLAADKKENRFGDVAEVISKVDDTGGLTAVQEAVDRNVFLSYDGQDAPVLLRGFDFSAVELIYKIPDKLTDGRLPEKDDEIIVGKELREDLNLSLDKEVQLIKPNGKKQPATVVGFFDLKVANLNNSWVITEGSTVQQLFDLGDDISSLEIQVSDVFQADALAGQIRDNLGRADIEVTDWKGNNAQLLSGLQGQTFSSLTIQVVVLFSVVVAIAGVLSISVSQKSRQIGILKAMGLTNSAASRIFITQGFILGLIGAAVGLGLGLGLFQAFITFAKNPDGSSLVEPLIKNEFIFYTWVIAVIAATLAGLLPAGKSARLNPIDIIRNG